MAFLGGTYLSTGSEMLLPLLLLSQILGGSLSQAPGYELKAPASVTAQEGLCIQVPCSFSYPSYISPHDFPALGSWFRSGANTDKDKPVATNDPKKDVQEEARGRFHLVGDPGKNNCSLSIIDVQKNDSGQYFFWIERGTAVQFNYKDYMVNVSVKALTQKPDIYIPETLEPGHLVKVACLVPWICVWGIPPVFSWTGAVLFTQKLSRETLFFSELTLTPRAQDHGSNLTCRVTLPGAGVSTERSVQLMLAGEEKSSWPLVLTLLRGGLMAVGFLLTYGLTYLYYSRKSASSGQGLDHFLAFYGL
ncbi:sialic acid-binding Ig-like lectin 14 [Dromiciops gliroides]|uniref:sialic acid-binding Ig-like lectin 14 n=1 Tax=Dromiciops gliroides TaxID=33562 RepID=UPI001CC55F80|nr:sialic acid-binding Ig-like lectin 14 [Dromiciops gliroides]